MAGRDDCSGHGELTHFVLLTLLTLPSLLLLHNFQICNSGSVFHHWTHIYISLYSHEKFPPHSFNFFICYLYTLLFIHTLICHDDTLLFIHIFFRHIHFHNFLPFYITIITTSPHHYLQPLSHCFPHLIPSFVTCTSSSSSKL